MAYATALDLRSQINKSDTTDDAILTSILSAAELTINNFCNRPDGFMADSVATPRMYAGSGKPYQFIDEFVEITLVGVKEAATDSTYTSWLAGDWVAFSGDPRAPDFQPLAIGRPYTAIMINPTGDQSLFHSGRWVTRPGFRPEGGVGRGVPTVQITAKWGYSVAVPAAIKEATIMQSARWYKRLQGAMADALASAELGAMLYRQSLDPDIKMILVSGRYIKPTVGRR